MKLFILFCLGCLLGTLANAQLFGAYKCAESDNYCGPADLSEVCTPASSQDARDAVLTYLSGIGSGNLNLSASVTTGDGGPNVPPFVFNWHGPQSLIPIAGSFTGANALFEFFGGVNSDVTDFTFNSPFYPPSGGVLISAYNCLFVFAQWQEESQVISTGKRIIDATNTVRYTMLNTSSPVIAVADVWVDVGTYQDAFCPSQIVCSSVGRMALGPAALLILVGWLY